MSKDFVQIANDVVTGAGLLRQGASDAMTTFASLAKAAMAPNALDAKTKELMAVAIGIAVRCEGCIAYHTRMAHRHGATRRNRRHCVQRSLSLSVATDPVGSMS
jgi:AhpD family alkylhydroperoxidase